MDVTQAATATQASRLAPILTIGAIFFVLGFVTWLNGPLITFVRLAFQLGDVGAFAVPLVFYISYFVFALPSAALLRLTGLKGGISLGLLVIAVGVAAFGECATWRVYPGALAGLFVTGGGLALLQTAVNPYVSILGPIEGAARRIALMGICNKTAGILAPIALNLLALRDIGALARRVAAAPDEGARDAILSAFAAGVSHFYLLMAALLVVAAVLIPRSPLPALDPGRVNAGQVDTGGAGGLAVPRFWFGVAALFVYVGAEVMAGDAIGTYGQAFGLPLDQTKFFTSFTLAAMLLGYLCGLALVPRVLSQAAYLAASAGLGVVLTLAAWASTGTLSVLFVAALGFANAMMWPAIFPLAISGLGAATARGSAILVMGICGGAIIPQAFAWAKQTHDMQVVFAALMVPSYLVILAFALFASRRLTSAR